MIELVLEQVMNTLFNLENLKRANSWIIAVLALKVLAGCSGVQRIPVPASSDCASRFITFGLSFCVPAGWKFSLTSEDKCDLCDPLCHQNGYQGGPDRPIYVLSKTGGSEEINLEDNRIGNCTAHETYGDCSIRMKPSELGQFRERYSKMPDCHDSSKSFNLYLVWDEKNEEDNTCLVVTG